VDGGRGDVGVLGNLQKGEEKAEKGGTGLERRRLISSMFSWFSKKL